MLGVKRQVQELPVQRLRDVGLHIEIPFHDIMLKQAQRKVGDRRSIHQAVGQGFGPAGRNFGVYDSLVYSRSPGQQRGVWNACPL